MYGNMQKSPQIRMIAMQDLAKDAFQARNLEKMLISTSSDPPLGIVAMIYPKTIYIYIFFFSYIDQVNFQKSYLHPIRTNLQNINAWPKFSVELGSRWNTCFFQLSLTS